MYLSFFIILLVLSLTALAVAFEETQDVAGNLDPALQSPIDIAVGKPPLTSAVMMAEAKEMNHLRSNNIGLNSMQQVRLQYWFPTSTSLYRALDSIEYIDRGLTYPSFGDYFSMAVTANDLTITMLMTSTWTIADFNGWTLTDVTGGLDFSGARILQSTGSTSLIRLTSTANKITVNWTGDPFFIDDVLVIGFNSDVSE